MLDTCCRHWSGTTNGGLTPQLFETSFEEMERQIRDTLGRALAGGGFDPARDIEAITINRWSHGYALEYMRPWDEFWPDGPLPIVGGSGSPARVLALVER